MATVQKVKIGDKVKCIRTYGICYLDVGKIYTVSGFNSHNYIMVKELDLSRFILSDYMFEKVDIKFKKGSIVKVIGSSESNMLCEVGTIISRSVYENCWNVKSKEWGSSVHVQYVHEMDMEIIDNSQAKEIKRSVIKYTDDF